MAAPQASARPAQGVLSGTLGRSLLLGAFLALWIVGLIARLYCLQVIDYVDFVARAQRQQLRTVEVAPERGAIFDARMRPLAMSVAVDSIYAVPSEIADRDLVAKVLGPALGLDPAELGDRLNASRSFCWVKRKVSDTEAVRVQQLGLKGVYFQKETKRFYPKGELAAHVLGYVGLDDEGLAGLEFGMNKAIRGQPGRLMVAADARHQSFLSTEWRGEPGQNVVLTIDENIQYIAERALAEVIEKTHAAGGAVVVQSPSTGRILAMADYPTLDANAYARSAPEDRINRGAAWVYEPGSVFKLVTVSAALEEKLTTPTEMIDCQMGKIMIGRHTIHDWKHFGVMSVADVIAHSSDVGAIKLGLRLGDDRFYRYIRDYGFGQKTGIELPGEERGLLEPPNRWSGISIGSMSIGQEIGVTPLQIISAYSAIANGGVLIEPRVVGEVLHGNQRQPMPPAPSRRVVSEHTAELMKEMLAGVVDHGTGQTAKLSGYSAAGKSGTAQKIESGHYSASRYVSSFIGFAPVGRPAITILVAIDSPVGEHHGGVVGSPVFRSIAEQTLGYLDVPQDNPAQFPLIASSVSAAPARQLRESAMDTLPTDSESPETTTHTAFEPISFDNSFGPAPQAAPEAGGTVVVDRGPLTKVPDFSGLAVRGVAGKCQQLGLDLNVQGSGLAVEQSPLAGSEVPAGSGVTVRFAR